jgi:hypothetical protein
VGHQNLKLFQLVLEATVDSSGVGMGDKVGEVVLRMQVGMEGAKSVVEEVMRGIKVNRWRIIVGVTVTTQERTLKLQTAMRMRQIWRSNNVMKTVVTHVTTLESISQDCHWMWRKRSYGSFLGALVRWHDWNKNEGIRTNGPGTSRFIQMNRGRIRVMECWVMKTHQLHILQVAFSMTMRWEVTRSRLQWLQNQHLRPQLWVVAAMEVGVGFEGVIVGVVEVLTDVMEEDTDPGLTDVTVEDPSGFLPLDCQLPFAAYMSAGSCVLTSV